MPSWKRLPVSIVSPKTRIATRHGQLYIMAGSHQKKSLKNNAIILFPLLGAKFQECVFHGVDACKQCSERMSLTFRCTAAGFRDLKGRGDMVFQWLDEAINIAWNEVWHEVSPALEADVTCMFGKEFNNAGRKSAELVLPTVQNFQYKYGRKTHPGKPMGPVILSILEQVERLSGRKFDWCHVTYYPTGTAKLGKHSDDEKEIAPGSDIACVTLFADAKATRDVYFQGKKRNEESPSKRRKNA